MRIGKIANDRSAGRRSHFLFSNARSAFKAFLRTVCADPGVAVLLPSYIGWSANEGSGVFDPVAELDLAHDFYRMDDRLRIDLADLENRLGNAKVKVLVLIHYFGRVDPGYGQAVKLAREKGVLVLEDEAHALLTDFVGGVSGRLGDACIYSLHKILPVSVGGMLVLNPSLESMAESFGGSASPGIPSPFDYDFLEIARRRRENAEIVSGGLRRISGRIEPLWEGPASGEVPQTFPVRVMEGSRDELYFKMNEAGFGVVSLYHTLIPGISPERFEGSHRLSRRILNLPVHQDADPRSLEEMLARLEALVSGPLSGRGDSFR